MFSAGGKKKLLLQIKRAKEKGIELDPSTLTLQSSNNSPLKTLPTSKEPIHEGKVYNRLPPSQRWKISQNPIAKKGTTIASKSNLERLLDDKDTHGIIMKRILEATTRYDPGKNDVSLRAFDDRKIDYNLFRNNLSSIFWLRFSDHEFEYVLDVYDNDGVGTVDGYQFMLSFIKLRGIKKDKDFEIAKRKQERYERELKIEEEKKKFDAEKKMELAADFNYGERTRREAIGKLKHAAKSFDVMHPQTPSLEGLVSAIVKPAEFREICKRTFNLQLNRAELGAVLNAFNESTGNPNRHSENEEEDGTGEEAGQSTQSNIVCGDFIKYFLRLGVDLRDRERAENRKRNEKLIKKAAEEEKKREDEKANKLTTSVSFDFSEVDEARAMHKLTVASTKYDKNAPGSQSLDGFECKDLSAVEFKDLVRRVFNLQLNSKELGFLVRKFSITTDGRINCKKFLGEFLRLGQEKRDEFHLAQLEKQRRLDIQAEEEHQAKMKSVLEKKTFKIDYNFNDNHLNAAMEKLIDASTKYDKSRGVSLASFEKYSLNAQEFEEALFRTFHLKFSAPQLGALVCKFDKEGNGQVVSKDFMIQFVNLGMEARAREHTRQLEANREGERLIREEHEKKLEAQANKCDIDVDFTFTEEDKDKALIKLTTAATKYDKNAPGAMSLEGFEVKNMPATLFKEMLRRTFNLKLNGKETGALVSHFDKSGKKTVNCKEFLVVFLQLGITERAKFHKRMLDKQNEENRQRELEEERKLLERVTRPTELDKCYNELDQKSANAKLLAAAEGFDKNHPAAPSLAAFDISTMTPGLFKENLKRCFNVNLTSKELGYVVQLYDTKNCGEVDSKEFLTRFLTMGKKERFEKHRIFLEGQRKAIKEAKIEEERKLAELWDKAEFKTDGKFSSEDMDNAMEKICEQAEKFDKSHSSAPSLNGFTGGAMKPGEFRELVRRTFNVALTPTELNAIVAEYRFDKAAKTIDTKKFLNFFTKLGFELRAKTKQQTLEKQRRDEAEREKERQRKLRLATQKTLLNLEKDFENTDRTSAYDKLTVASAKYDKNAPGCVPLDVFDAKFLNPGEFREAVKRTFNVALTPKELAALVKDFDTGEGNVLSQSFVVVFLKLGADERAKAKSVQLELNRRNDILRKTEHARKIKEAEDKMILDISYDFKKDDEQNAFKKVAIAAKKYDKNAPGAMSLDGFEEKEMKALTFKEMIRRTFGLMLAGAELGAVMKFFDDENKGVVNSKKFLNYFLKVGFDEREKDHVASLKKSREDAAMAKKQHEQILAAQWAKMELKVTDEFDEDDREEAVKKLNDAAFKFDPKHAGPMGLTAFEAKSLSNAVFREMLKRNFSLVVTDRELAAIISLFDKNERNEIICKDFLIKFIQLGNDIRNDMRLKQIELQRKQNKEREDEAARIMKELNDKIVINVDSNFTKEDFNSALAKIQVAASGYDQGHPSAPNLNGFMGSDMSPTQFKDMIFRTFKIQLEMGELGALVKFFDSEGKARVNTQEFLAYFYRIARAEKEAVRRSHIEAEKNVKKQAEDYKLSLEKKKLVEEQQKLVFNSNDEKTFMDKFRKALQDYAVDSSPYVDSIQSFKGPAFNPKSFREVFYRIFLIRFTFPEVGVLLSIVDSAGSATIDGPLFLNWFYKLARKEERIMLGEAKDDFTIENLKVDAGEALSPSKPLPTQKITSPPPSTKKSSNTAITNKTEKKKSLSASVLSKMMNKDNNKREKEDKDHKRISPEKVDGTWVPSAFEDPVVDWIPDPSFNNSFTANSFEMTAEKPVETRANLPPPVISITSPIKLSSKNKTKSKEYDDKLDKKKAKETNLVFTAQHRSASASAADQISAPPQHVSEQLFQTSMKWEDVLILPLPKADTGVVAALNELNKKSKKFDNSKSLPTHLFPHDPVRKSSKDKAIISAHPIEIPKKKNPKKNLKKDIQEGFFFPTIMGATDDDLDLFNQ